MTSVDGAGARRRRWCATTAHLLPGWTQTAAAVNPVDRAIEAGRSATAASPDWGLVAVDAALLVGLLVACDGLATRAFRNYQASV